MSELQPTSPENTPPETVDGFDIAFDFATSYHAGENPDPVAHLEAAPDPVSANLAEVMILETLKSEPRNAPSIPTGPPTEAELAFARKVEIQAGVRASE